MAERVPMSIRLGSGIDADQFGAVGVHDAKDCWPLPDGSGMRRREGCVLVSQFADTASASGRAVLQVEPAPNRTDGAHILVAHSSGTNGGIVALALHKAADAQFGGTIATEFYLGGSSVNVNAGQSTTITVYRTNGLSLASSVRIKSANETAIAGTDYTAVDQVLTFAANETSQDVTVETLSVGGDLTQFTVGLQDPASNATLAHPDKCEITISNPNVPVALAWLSNAAGNTMHPAGSSDLANCVVAYNAGSNKLYYYGFQCTNDCEVSSSLELSYDASKLFVSELGFRTGVIVDWTAMKLAGPLLRGVTLPPTLTALTYQHPVTELTYSADVSDVGTGYEWVSRSGIHYAAISVAANQTNFKIQRHNASTGALIGTTTVSPTLPGGAVLCGSPSFGSVTPMSRPDAQGYVVVAVQTSISGTTFQWFLVKFNPATGVVAAQTEITSFGAGTGSSDISKPWVVPVITGGVQYYFLQIKTSGSYTNWYIFSSDLATSRNITSSASTNQIGVTSRILLNACHSGNVYGVATSSVLSANPRLIRIGNITTGGTAITLSIAAADLPSDPLNRQSQVDNESMDHLLIDSNTLMFGMFGKYALPGMTSAGTVTRADEYSLHSYSGKVPGGASFTSGGFAWQRIQMASDPYNVLKASEGYLE